MPWNDVKEQPVAVRVLQAHLARQCVPPAYLFAGPSGVGKRLAAIELAKALNCERALGRGARRVDSCDTCASCSRMLRRSHPDLHELSPQGASQTIRIEEIRHMLGRVALRPFMARLQVVVLDGADRLTEEAANSLLKTLEEPPRWTRFILITSQPAHCLPTVVSRCQTIRFQRLRAATVEQLLVAQKRCDAETAAAVSPLAEGSVAFAAELAADWASYRAMLEQFATERAADWLSWSPPADRDGVGRWIRGATGWLRDVAVAAAGHEGSVRHAAGLAAIRRQARLIDVDRCVDAASRLVQLAESLDHMANPRLVGMAVREAWLSAMQPAIR